MMPLAAWVLAGATAAGTAPPGGAAENEPGVSPYPGGLVAPGPRRTVTLEAMLVAVGQDAARRIPSPNGRPLPRLVKPVTWADSSLGCPAPGAVSTRALDPGWQIVIGDGKRWLSYHASQRGAWLLCPPGRERVPLTGAAGR